MRALLLILAMGLAGCDGAAAPDAGTDPPAAASASPASPGAEPPTPPPPAPALPGLRPLGAARVAAEIGAGPRCALSDGGRVLMAVSARGAVIDDQGRIVRLARDAGDGIAAGGRFAADDLAVEVRPGGEIGRAGDGVVRDAGAAIVRDRHGFSVSHGLRWTCAPGA
ncbi:hypothetical protein E2493_17625 [Sphingomonas parva]|uniref:Uncharacterized protein n=1 Tax=Sphingomonas parva TaxID=2555898 RepID=A0A4Y8ZP66_9SPHN|nr:hypothetical protein [Sphingomonas parva]TFI56945.1 hypothetical protein E2493_17625 [Sphingomonas parva]